MQLKRGPTLGTGHQQAVEVSAGAKPSEVVNAVLKGAESQSRPQSLWFQRERPIQLAFLFVLIFGVIVYFREEIWAFSNDVSKHPIMAYTEQLQIRKWVGTQWLFTSGSKMDPEIVEVLEKPSTDAASKDPAKAQQSPAPVPKPAAATNSTQAARSSMRRLLMPHNGRKVTRRVKKRAGQQAG